jgi:lysosome membrane protein 2
VVTQVGPYVYREWRTKTNLTWNGNETVVHYDLNVTYTFEPSMSSGDPKHDRIITLNIPFYVLLLQIEGHEGGLNKDEKDFVQKLLKEAEKESGEGGLFTEQVVYDLLFGYNDSLLAFIVKEIEAVPDDLPLVGNLVKRLKNLAKTINPLFGLENVTEVEYGNQVYTGKDDLSQIGQFIEWNGNFEIYKHGGWGTPAAKMLNGTAGFIFPPDVKKEHNLTAFISELYRSGYFSFTEVKTLYGINLYRYVLPRDELVSANQDPGFYANGPNGLLNLTAVFEENAPVFASKPHFLDADKGYLNNVTGMDPVRSLHDSNLDVEPITGAVMRAAKRIQINLRLVRNSDFVETEKIMPLLMMPVFWASEEGSLTKSLANKFKKKVYVAKYGMEGAVWGGVGLGGLVFLTMSLCFVGLVIQQCRYRRGNQRPVATYPDEDQPLLN